MLLRSQISPDPRSHAVAKGKLTKEAMATAGQKVRPRRHESFSRLGVVLQQVQSQAGSTSAGLCHQGGRSYQSQVSLHQRNDRIRNALLSQGSSPA